MIYRQCSFENVKTNGLYTAWIPNEKAKIGKILKIKLGGVWQDGWKVIKAGIVKDESYIKFKQESNRSFGESIK